MVTHTESQNVAVSAASLPKGSSDSPTDTSAKKPENNPTPLEKQTTPDASAKNPESNPSNGKTSDAPAVKSNADETVHLHQTHVSTGLICCQCAAPGVKMIGSALSAVLCANHHANFQSVWEGLRLPSPEEKSGMEIYKVPQVQVPHNQPTAEVMQCIPSKTCLFVSCKNASFEAYYNSGIAYSCIAVCWAHSVSQAVKTMGYPIHRGATVDNVTRFTISAAQLVPVVLTPISSPVNLPEEPLKKVSSEETVANSNLATPAAVKPNKTKKGISSLSPLSGNKWKLADLRTSWADDSDASLPEDCDDKTDADLKKTAVSAATAILSEAKKASKIPSAGWAAGIKVDPQPTFKPDEKAIEKKDSTEELEFCPSGPNCSKDQCLYEHDASKVRCKNTYDGQICVMFNCIFSHPSGTQKPRCPHNAANKVCGHLGRCKTSGMVATKNDENHVDMYSHDFRICYTLCTSAGKECTDKSCIDAGTPGTIGYKKKGKAHAWFFDPKPKPTKPTTSN